jgi:hypothetical protein
MIYIRYVFLLNISVQLREILILDDKELRDRDSL